MATSRLDLRRAIADELGDLRTFRCTAESGSPTVFVDEHRLVFENGTLAGRDAVAYTGANKAQWRVVRSNSRGDRSLTFWSGFPVDFAIGDELDLYNWQGRGWHKDHYDRTINSVLQEVGRGARVPIVDDAIGTFSKEDPYLDLPEEMVWLESVEYFVPEDANVVDRANGYWGPIELASEPGGAGWYPVGEGRIVVNGRWRTLAHERALRVVGKGVPSLLYDDTDETAVDFEYLKLRAASSLLTSSIHRQVSAERERQLGVIESKLRDARPRTGTRWLPSAVKVR